MLGVRGCFSFVWQGPTVSDLNPWFRPYNVALPLCWCLFLIVLAAVLLYIICCSILSAGTIWMQEILPLVVNGGDLTPIHTIPNWDRAPWLEEKRLALVVDQLTSPRVLVTHFPYHLMPPSFHTSKAKVSGWRLCVILPCEPLFCASMSSAALRYWIIVHERTQAHPPKPLGPYLLVHHPGGYCLFYFGNIYD